MKCSFLFPFLLILLPASAFAADFTANIDSDHIRDTESFALHLKLSDATAKGLPNIDPLKQSFAIVAVEKLSSVSNVNGRDNFSLGWRITLIPKGDGRLTVPSLAINTSAGILHTAPVTLEVDPVATDVSPPEDTSDGLVSITAKADTTTPYQNQPIQYTVRCVARASMSDVTLSGISVDNAIVEQQGQPIVQFLFENHAPVRVVEFHYTITPMQPGKIAIPPVVLQGDIETQDRGATAGPFERLFMAGVSALSNFTSNRPFRVASNKISLEVKPPPVAMDPWLPLKSLKIAEDLIPSHPSRVGEPMTRKITLSAVGAVGTQLPDVEAQEDHKNFRVYADKPVIDAGVDIKSGTIWGRRTESYTMIPQRAGRLVLPPIRIAWWDTVNNKAATAELPERIVEVQPRVPVRNTPDASVGFVGANRNAVIQSTPRSSWARRVLPDVDSQFLYRPPVILAAILLFGMSGIVWLWRKSGRQKTARARTVFERAGSRKFFLRSLFQDELKHVHTAEGLKGFLQNYAREHWGTSRNVPLEGTFVELRKSFACKETEEFEAIVGELAAVLYAGKVVEIDALKERSRRVLATLKRETHRSRRFGQKLPSLNPN